MRPEYRASKVMAFKWLGGVLKFDMLILVIIDIIFSDYKKL